MAPLQDISELRFNALAAYCRTPQTLAAAEEVLWLQSESEAILVVVIRDRPDQDYGALIRARDARERYRRVDVHRWGPKEIPAGFFRLPGAENISAVIFNNSATISKFNRMGLLAWTFRE